MTQGTLTTSSRPSEAHLVCVTAAPKERTMITRSGIPTKNEAWATSSKHTLEQGEEHTCQQLCHICMCMAACVRACVCVRARA